MLFIVCLIVFILLAIWEPRLLLLLGIFTALGLLIVFLAAANGGLGGN